MVHWNSEEMKGLNHGVRNRGGGGSLLKISTIFLFVTSVIYIYILNIEQSKG